MRKLPRLIAITIIVSIAVPAISIAVPVYQKARIRTKESLLKNNLFTMRTVIDEYTFDKKKAPQSLQDLVSEGYLRSVPIDPMTGRDSSWVTVTEDSLSMVDQTAPG